MTRTTPLRLTILHFSHRFFTDGLTFIFPLSTYATQYNFKETSSTQDQSRVNICASPSITAIVCSK